jgi:hypothetical protein
MLNGGLLFSVGLYDVRSPGVFNGNYCSIKLDLEGEPPGEPRLGRSLALQTTWAWKFDGN